MNVQAGSDEVSAAVEHEGLSASLRGMPLSRRTLLRAGLSAAAGLSVGPMGMGNRLLRRPAHAKAVIQIWMWGGPSHLDTFDPKPEAGSDYCGPLDSPIGTNADGIQIGQLLPQLATQADKYSIIRSMTHGVNAHETASYVMQTGRPPGDGVVWPSAGAVTSLHRGYDAGFEGLIPPYVVLTEPQGRFSEAGFLGNRYKPFATGGDPGAKSFLVEGVSAEGISEARQRNRRDLKKRLDALSRALKDDGQIKELKESEERAYELILGDAGKIFDLSTEDQSLRERYGTTTFGQSCLMARRLVEQGVPYITINYKGWDTHKQHFEIMRRQLPQMDRGLATLLQDLSDRGLLDSTIVWWGGEFGRTPKIRWDAPWNGGRGHHGHVFSSVVAGGGFKGGQVIGASDPRGERVEDRPVYPWDLTRSIYELMGIDPDGTMPHPDGRMVRITPAATEVPESAGRLNEIMPEARQS